MLKLTVPTIFTAVDKLTGPMGRMSDSMQKFADKAADIGKKSAIGALAIAAPLALFANSAIEFQDRLADISKTTGLTGKALDGYGDTVLNLAKTTRTSIADLLTIGEIGGQLGVPTSELARFTEASNKFAVALGSDYGGVEAAITQVGKIKNLFKETRGLDISSVITKAGSAINTLGSIGSGTSANINDFILRMGALPDAIKPSLQTTAALGTFFEEVGLDAQVASGGLSNFFLVAGKNIDKFAKQMGMGSGAAKALFATDPTKFATKFAASLNGLSPDKLAKKLQFLGVGTQETIKVVGALGSGLGRLAELQAASNKAFDEGLSLQMEYATKNATVAAKIAIAQHNFEVFSIMIGTKLLPVLGDLLDRILPVIASITDWIDKNPGLVTTILQVAGGVAAFLLVVSTVSTIVSMATKVMWFFNIVLAANPIGALVLAIGIFIGLMALAIAKWDEWGAALAAFLGPLGWIISLIQSFRKNWDLIKKAFKENGIIAGLKAIGATILDTILKPLQQLLSLIARLTGFEWAKNAAKGLHDFREDMGVNMEGDPLNPKPALPPPPPTPHPNADNRNQAINHNLSINLNDPAGLVKETKLTGPIQPSVFVTRTFDNR